MLKLNKTQEKVQDVFGITKEDIETLFAITKGFHNNDTLVISKVLQRLWVDEVMSDNVKCWAIFELGRWCGRHEAEEGL